MAMEMELATLQEMATGNNGNSASADGNTLGSDIGNINVGLPSITLAPAIDVPITK
ncbi:hypothetical protein FKW77_001361 [Venturia effusa]|uniref:Uncharacterized protein n=1 Tax=Venturia effusa TaxID=50376 RepID=A0A517KVT0_9PEZI|nr:hypothetical protein FKW77_001361 [Venturia effusa]